MKARDIMVSPVITVKPEYSVKDVAAVFWQHGISGAPVVNGTGKLVGIISEGDLMHRAEIGTERQRPLWFLQLTTEEILAGDYVKAHSRLVDDLMTRNVITATPDTSLNDIAALLENNAIKRVPIIEQGGVIGIVSRANLIQALTTAQGEVKVSLSDEAIRPEILHRLNEHRWAHTSHLNVIVHDGIVELWGTTNSEVMKSAIRTAVESTPGVRAVNDHLIIQPREPPAKIERDITSR